MKNLLMKCKSKLAEYRGIGTIEMLMILAVLIGIVILFKGELITVVEELFGDANEAIMEIWV